MASFEEIKNVGVIGAGTMGREGPGHHRHRAVQGREHHQVTGSDHRRNA